MKAGVLAGVLALLAVGLAGCGDDDSDSAVSDSGISSTTTAGSSGESTVVRIGALAELSGARGPIAEPFVAAAKLRLAQINDEAASDFRFELVVEDTKGDNQETIAAFRRLVDKGVAAVWGPTSTPGMVATVAAAEELAVPQVGWSGSSDVGGGFQYRMQIGAFEIETVFLARAAIADGSTAVATFGEANPAGDGYLAAFQTAAAAEELTVTKSVQVDPATPDVSALVAQLKDSGAEALVYLGSGEAYASLIAALEQLDWDPTVYNPLAFLTTLRGGSVEEVYGSDVPNGWVALGQVSEANPRTAAFSKEWLEENPDSPITFGHIAAADTMTLITESVILGRSPLPADVHEALQQTKDIPAALGGPGTTMTLGPDRREVYDTEDFYFYFKVVDGEVVAQ